MPSLATRAVHLDLKGLLPTPQRLVSLLPVFAAAGFNALLVEWEDTFPWTVDPRFRCETAYTSEEVDRFHAEAARLGMEVIPLVQCLGHMETPLSVRGYEHLREVPEKSDVLSPVAPGARQLIENMVDDVLARTPHLTRFHLGGDEAWSFGTHPDTKAFIERHGKGALYLHHVEPILDKLNARGIRPILWHDMMNHWDDDAVQRLSRKADLCVWGYGGHPDTTPHHFNTKHIRRFAELGVTLWGATAYKGAEGHDADLPDLAGRQENAQAWADVAGRFGMTGVFATAWSRYSTHRQQTIPIDAALDALMIVGSILRDGRPMSREQALARLGEIGELPRFEACRSAMQKLSDARRSAWRNVQWLRQQLVTATQDARRRGSRQEAEWLRYLRNDLSAADAAGEEMGEAFDGLVDRLWIERYVAERIEPIREELGLLEPRVRQIEAQ